LFYNGGIHTTQGAEALMTPTPADVRSADLLDREAAILRIKAIEARYGLQSVVANKEERRLLHVLRVRPDIAEKLRELLIGNETA
jgi:hypothetical protein